MKRHTSLKSNVFSPLSSLVGQDIIYMQMSHHYRRLLTAKSNVRSNQPNCQPKQLCFCQKTSSPERVRRLKPQQRKDSLDSLNSYEEPSPSEMVLVERIIYDDKHRPEQVYREHLAGKWHEECSPRPNPLRHDCMVSHSEREKSKHPSVVRQSSVQRSASKKARVPADLLERHRESFEPGDLHKPRILKTAAQSHVRDMKVYHPPRRKPKKPKQESEWGLQMQSEEKDLGLQSFPPESSEWLKNMGEQDVPTPTLCVQCQCDVTLPQPSSKVSIASRDSAYNGGVSSGGESRGPTPEQVGLTNLSNRCGTTNKEQSMNKRNQSPARQPLKHYNVTGTIAPLNEKKKVSKTNRSPSRPPVKRYDTSPVPKPTHERKSRKKKSSSHQPARLMESTGYGRVPLHDPSVKIYRQPVGPTISRTPRDDMQYAAFSQRITEDILTRDILSSKGINAVFQRHMDENEGLLEKDLMQKEVDLLRLQLGLDKCNVSSFKELPVDTNFSDTSLPSSDPSFPLTSESSTVLLDKVPLVSLPKHPNTNVPKSHNLPMSDHFTQVNDYFCTIWPLQSDLVSGITSLNGIDTLSLEATRNQCSQVNENSFHSTNSSVRSCVLNSTFLENEEALSSLVTTRDRCVQVGGDSVPTLHNHLPSQTSSFNTSTPGDCSSSKSTPADNISGSSETPAGTKKTADAWTQVTGSLQKIGASSSLEEHDLHLDEDLGVLSPTSGGPCECVLRRPSRSFSNCPTPSDLQYRSETDVDRYIKVNDNSHSECPVESPHVSSTTTPASAISGNVVDPLTLKMKADLSSQLTGSLQKPRTVNAHESMKENPGPCPSKDTNELNNVVYTSNNVLVADKSAQTVEKSEEQLKMSADFSSDFILSQEEPQIKRNFPSFSMNEKEEELEQTSQKERDEISQEKLEEKLSKEWVGTTGRKDSDEHKDGKEAQQTNESSSGIRTVNSKASSSTSSEEEVIADFRELVQNFVNITKTSETALPTNSLTTELGTQPISGFRRKSTQMNPK